MLFPFKQKSMDVHIDILVESHDAAVVVEPSAGSEISMREIDGGEVPGAITQKAVQLP